MLLVDVIAELQGAEVSDIVTSAAFAPHLYAGGGVDVQDLSCQHHAATKLDANKVHELRLHSQL